MNILITGGKGFLAGRVTEFLRKKNFKVILCSRSKSDGLKYINWESNKNLNKICNKIDIIINCAGLDSHGCKSKKKAFTVNSIYPFRLYKAAVKNNVKLFIFLSTFHVYKTNSSYIYEGEKLNKNNIYTLSKIKGEQNLLRQESKKTKVLILRICNLFGYPYFKNKNCWRLLINSIVKDLIKKNKFKIKSKENSYRNYSSIQSFNEFIFNFILKMRRIKKIPKIINYCSDRNINITEICKIVLKTVNNKKNHLLYKYPAIRKVKKSHFSSKYQSKFKKKKDKHFYQELNNLIRYAKQNLK